VQNAAIKRRRKQVPLLVANHAQEALGRDENQVTLVDDSGTHRLPRMGKLALARRLGAEIARRLPRSSGSLIERAWPLSKRL
jgi:phosphopantothenoylcysteine decarboxylase / phosphopantothenate---cysteine ligase